MTTRMTLLAAALCAGPGACDLSVSFGPYGQIEAVRVSGVTYLSRAAVSLIVPGWAGNLGHQARPEADAVSVAHDGDVTTYESILVGEGAQTSLRMAVSATEDSVTLRYEFVPETDLEVETVLFHALIPEEHAGQVAYTAADDQVTTGTLPAELDADHYAFYPGQGADWVILRAPGAEALRIRPEGLNISLQDDRKFDQPGYGLLLAAPVRSLTAGRPVRFAVTLEAMTAQAADEAVTERRRGSLAGVAMGDDRPLALEGVTLDKTTTAVYEPVEITLDLEASYANPFDPDDIAVDARVTTPSGRVVTAPGFYYVPFECELENGAERLRVTGAPSFRVRYAPAEEGRHEVVIVACDGADVVESAPLSLEAMPAQSSGHVRVSAANPRVFAHDDGSTFFPIGENVCWSGRVHPLEDYRAWLAGLGGGGGNWARLWLAFSEKGLEWMPRPTPKAGYGSYTGLGRYALDNAWRLDEILRIAGENGVRLMFCIGTYGEFTTGGYFGEGSWISNPYNAANGGPCAEPEEFFTHGEARRLHKQRLRYLIARWGYSTDLFAWEFWNEVPPNPDVAAWTAEMARYLKEHDPNHHLVSTTYGNGDIWECPDIDFTMTHVYGQAGATADFTERIARETEAMRAFGKPYILAEFGIDWQTSDLKWDPAGIGTNLHNGLWASVLSGGSGTAMLWYWDHYVHPCDLYHVFRPIRDFVDRVDWAEVSLATPSEQRVGASSVTSLRDGPDETFGEVTVSHDVMWGATPSSAYTVLPDGSVEGRPVACAIGSPTRGNPGELPTSLTWRLDMPVAGPVIVHLSSVCQRARLQISLDGERVVDRELLAGEPGAGPWRDAIRLEEYDVWVSRYEEDITIEVPEGPHELVIANAEGDWLQITELRIPQYRSSRIPDVDCLVLGGEHTLVAWLRNRESNWRADLEGRQPRELVGIQATLPDAAPGLWHTEWWDTHKGGVLAAATLEADENGLTVEAPPFTRDVALRAWREP